MKEMTDDLIIRQQYNLNAYGREVDNTTYVGVSAHHQMHRFISKGRKRNILNSYLIGTKAFELYGNTVIVTDKNAINAEIINGAFESDITLFRRFSNMLEAKK